MEAPNCVKCPQYSPMYSGVKLWIERAVLPAVSSYAAAPLSTHLTFTTTYNVAKKTTWMVQDRIVSEAKKSQWYSHYGKIITLPHCAHIPGNRNASLISRLLWNVFTIQLWNLLDRRENLLNSEMRLFLIIVACMNVYKDTYVLQIGTFTFWNKPIFRPHLTQEHLYLMPAFVH